MQFCRLPITPFCDVAKLHLVLTPSDPDLKCFPKPLQCSPQNIITAESERYKVFTRQQQSAFMSSCQSFPQSRRHFFFPASSPPHRSLQTVDVSHLARSLFIFHFSGDACLSNFCSSSPFLSPCNFSLLLLLPLRSRNTFQ